MHTFRHSASHSPCFTSGPSSREHSSDSQGHCLLYCGEIFTDKQKLFPDYITHVMMERGKVEKKKQSTPAYAQAVAMDVIFMVNNKGESPPCWTMPQGGFTDVGKHTGSEPRDTCWPLVAATLQVLYPPCFLLLALPPPACFAAPLPCPHKPCASLNQRLSLSGWHRTGHHIRSGHTRAALPEDAGALPPRNPRGSSGYPGPSALINSDQHDDANAPNHGGARCCDAGQGVHAR